MTGHLQQLRLRAYYFHKVPPMAVNPYAPCPCGSGKKFKFCCQDVQADLMRVVSLSRNQPEIALNQMQQLAAKHPDRESVLRELVVMLLRHNRLQDALKACTDFLKAHPDNPQILLIYADICVQCSGFDASRRIVHRAFQVCTRQFPLEVSNIAARIGVEMFRRGMIPAAREHALLAVRLAGTEKSEVALSLFRRIEDDSNIPFLLSSSWPLLNFEASPEVLQQHERALRLCRLGCWEPAAIIYNRLADQAPTNSAIWYNMGLCQMWDGRHPEAAASLHHAAALSTDFEEAVEIEALAHVLDPKLWDDRVSVLSVTLNIRSVSEAVTRLLAHPSIKNTQTHDHANCNHAPGCSHAAELMLMSGPSPGPEDITPDNFAQFIADVDVYDITDVEAATAAGHAHPWLEITCSSLNVDHVLVALRDCIGDLILTGSDEEKRQESRSYPRFEHPFELRPVRPEGMSEHSFRRFTRQINAKALETALQYPLPLLGGKSMQEAAADPGLRRQLAGAAYLLQALALQMDDDFTIDSLRVRLSLPTRAPLAATAADNVNALSLLALARLPLQELSDTQLRTVISRSTAPGARELLKRALDELLGRSTFTLNEEALPLLISRATIAHFEGDSEVSYAYLEKARQAASETEGAFRLQLELDIRELSWRLQSREDAGIISLLHKIRDLYARKIPELVELIQEQLLDADCPHLLKEFLPEPSAPKTSALWTPGSPASAPAESAAPSGLWLPGQR
jgi:tetratricopeptide (TPR) repeat protein